MDWVGELAREGAYIDVATVVINAVGAGIVEILVRAVPKYVRVLGVEHTLAPAVVDDHIHFHHTVIGLERPEQVVAPVAVGGEDIGQAIIEAVMDVDAD